MGQPVSIYFPAKILEWVDAQAEKEERSRSNQVIKILVDVIDGRLVPAETEHPEIRKARLPPSART
jgi:hypothetical protein